PNVGGSAGVTFVGSGAATSSGAGTGSGGYAGTGVNGASGSPQAPVTYCPCSRKEGSPSSDLCRPGPDTSGTATLGSEGGTAVLNASFPLNIEVFPGSLTEDTTLTLTELSVSPPDGFVDFSPVYDIAPHGIDLVNGGGIDIIPHNSIWIDNPALTLYTA